MGLRARAVDIVRLEAWTDWAARLQAIVIFTLAMIAAIGLYALVIGTTLRSSAYLLYVGHSLSLLVFWSNYYGLPAELFCYTDHSRFVYKVAGTAATAIAPLLRSEEHTSELLSLMRISYAVFF